MGTGRAREQMGAEGGGGRKDYDVICGEVRAEAEWRRGGLGSIWVWREVEGVKNMTIVGWGVGASSVATRKARK